MNITGDERKQLRRECHEQSARGRSPQAVRPRDVTWHATWHYAARAARAGGSPSWHALTHSSRAKARPGAFPHVCCSHGEKPRMSWWHLRACIELPLASDGQHAFPSDALSDADIPDPGSN